MPRNTRQEEAETLPESKRGSTLPRGPWLVMLNGSPGTHEGPSPTSGLDLGVGRLDSEGKELRPNATANRPHKTSV